MSAIEANRDKILKKLKRLDSPEDKYRFLLDLAKSLPQLEEGKKLEQFLVPGCISKVWLIPQFSNGVLNFAGDSDAQIPKGIVALLLKIYNGHAPMEILNLDESFLSELGLADQLSFNRRNSIANFVKQIKTFAQAYCER